MHLHLLYLALGVLTGMAAIGLLMVIREGPPVRGPLGATRWHRPPGRMLVRSEPGCGDGPPGCITKRMLP